MNTIEASGALALLAALVVAFARPRLWPYVLFSVAPGLALAARGLLAQRTEAAPIGFALSLFATGTVVAGLPLAALGWWWLHRPGSHPGTLE